MADPDFGTELSCTNDVASDSRVVTGFRVVAEAVLRRWTTPRGRLIGYPNYGYDITQYINDDMDRRQVQGMIAGMQAEALKDERVTGCVISATLDDSGLLTFESSISTAQGPFVFTIAADAVTVKLLEVH